MTKNPQINITLGTAGHIDHGKTALVKLMTGCDTDRLKIEKERGMTIELGFAPCMISNMEIGIVDVPGHEHFIKTMVAGATGIDGVIFVIAADDSIMPQTREHLDILTLLGVQHGLVALTKIDMVNDERLELVTDQISKFLKGTFLQDKAICPISNVTGKGFDGFLEALKQVVSGIKPKPVEGIFRMPVEKSFSFSGFGTIVTGIPVTGHTKIGNEVVLLPANKKGRIKTIQVYSRKADIALSGQCAAINIPQFDYKTIQRGNVVTSADYFKTSRWYLGCLDILDSAQKPLKNASIVKLHTSTAETNAKVYLLEGKYVEPGSKKVLVQFCLEEPIVAGPKDRFIIRQPSPANTIGGGYIIEAIDQKIKRTDFNAVADIAHRAQAVQNITDFVEYCILTCPDHTARLSQVSVRTKQLPDFLGNIFSDLVARSRIVPLSKELYIHSQVLNKLKAEILNLCKLFHANNPESIGIANSELLQQSRLQNQLYNFLISDCTNSGLLVTKNNCLSLTSHRPVFNSLTEKNITLIENHFKENLFSPPPLHEVEQIINDQKTFLQSIKILLEQKTLIEIEKDIFFHSAAIEKIKSILAEYFQNNQQLESVKFKYLLDTSRKYALPLLDYMDKIGFTSRVGNTRFPRNIK